MSQFNVILKSRRSANKFLSDNPITKEQLDEIFEMVALSPSCFNLQHAKYHVALSEEKKSALYEASQQYKVATASAVIVVTGNKKAYKYASDLYEGSKFLGIITGDEFSDIVNDITMFHESRDEVFLRDEAIRNASLSSMVFMLSAKEKGWDTCPMIFFDSDKVKSILELKDEEEPVMMIPIGKMDESSNRIRGYRKPVVEIARYFK